MRRYLILIVLCVIFFIFPLQVFTISDNIGIGIQGATYRYQITVYGDSFILLTREISYILNGTLTGRTALSVILWLSGTVAIMSTIIYAFINVDDEKKPFCQQILYGVVFACILYLASSIAQYGIFFQSMAGSAIPLGVLLILFWILFLYKFSDFFLPRKEQ